MEPGELHSHLEVLLVTERKTPGGGTNASACLCIHRVLQKTKQHIFLLHARSIYTICVLSFSSTLVPRHTCAHMSVSCRIMQSEAAGSVKCFRRIK